MSTRLGIMALFAICGLLTVAASPADAATLYVDAAAPLGGDGLTWETAYRYLQDALLIATGDDEVHIAGGTYRTGDAEAGTEAPDPRAATFPLNPSVELYGGYAGHAEPLTPDNRDIQGYATILSGDIQNDDADIANPADMLWHDSRQDNSYHVITDMGTDPSTILDGLIISHGNASEPLYVINQSGAGIQNLVGGSPTIRNCTFRWNAAHGHSVGGAIANEDGCYPLVVNCLFEANWAGAGGAIACWGPTSNARLVNCTFRRNGADTGGAMHFLLSGPTLVNCTFEGNRAAEGGALGVSNANPTLVNCAFSGNRATITNGGAIFNHSMGTTTLINCTITANYAEYYGGGLFCIDDAVFTLKNCIITGNTAGQVPACFDILIDILGTVEADYCLLGCVGNWGGWYNPGPGVFSSEPHFFRPPDDGEDGWGDDASTPNVDEGSNDDYGNLRLRHVSPAIDSGDDTAVPPDTMDLDGDSDFAERVPYDCGSRPRFVEHLPSANQGVADPPDYPEIVDLGAYEYQAPGDFDGDGDLDLADYHNFAACLSGPGGGSPACLKGDFDGDGDVDLADFAAFLSAFTAP